MHGLWCGDSLIKIVVPDEIAEARSARDPDGNWVEFLQPT